jgi:hypothetical protein
LSSSAVKYQQGHSPNIRAVQFDRRFLVTDGTLNTIVVHDFAVSDSSEEFEIPVYDSEDEEEYIVDSDDEE